jgi:16S rRNA processing protein RimM
VTGSRREEPARRGGDAAASRSSQQAARPDRQWPAGKNPPAPSHLVVGHITKPHGTRGELLVWPLTDRPAGVYAAGVELLVGDTEGGLGEAPVAVVVAASRPFKKGLLVRFEGVGGRSDVEALVGRYLLADLGTLEPLAEGEVFYHQLLGLEVELEDGSRVGKVREVFESLPADLLEIETDGGRAILVPFTEQIVRLVDAAGGRLVIDPPPGLLEL